MANPISAELNRKINILIRARKICSLFQIIEAMRSEFALFDRNAPRNYVKSQIISALCFLINEEKSLKVAVVALKNVEETMIAPAEWPYETHIGLL